VTTDPITLEVARNRLAAVADEMGVVLRHTSLSPNIKERADCSAAVFTSGGEMLAQAEHIPVHLGSMPESVMACLRLFEPAPGTQFAVNDPFAGGTHLNDLTLVAPVFVGSDHVAWVANRAHHADVGGEAPGSMPAHATRLEQEGHVVNPMIAVHDDRWAEEFADPFIAASRTPWERRGDLAAQIGANAVGAARLAELVSGAGVAEFAALTDSLLDYGERRMTAALAGLPDGEYSFHDFMEHGEEDVVIRVATDPTIPANGGCYRPIELVAPAGTIVNALPPAAVAAGNVETSQRIADVVLGALAQAAPNRVPAASQGTMNNVLIGSDDFAYYETVAGGQGGRPGRAGQSGIHTGMTNTENTPIESLDAHFPFRVERYTLRRGSGGAGRFPGGEGIEREILFLAEATLSLMGERRRHHPWGLAGGGPGATGEDWLITSHGKRERLPGKTTTAVAPGDRLLVFTPGGGGWGAP
jgi:N-methylhydantoinase B